MDELLEILEDINPDIDYMTETNLIDGKMIDSFSIFKLIDDICETFDIEIGPKFRPFKRMNKMQEVQTETTAPKTTKKTENLIWDYAKMVMAFLVVGIHTSARTGNSHVEFFIESWLGRFAVPLFFCIAGYFLFSKVSDARTLTPSDSKIVWKYCVRVFRMYVVWTLIYLLPQGYTWMHDGVTVRDILIYIEYTIIRGDSYVHLWYLSSLCMAVFLIWALNHRLSRGQIFCVSAALFLFGLIWLPHHYLVESFVDSHAVTANLKLLLNRFLGWPRNGTFFGFIFVMLGVLLAKQKKYPSKKVSVSMAILFALLSFAEVAWIYRMHDYKEVYCALQLSLVPATYFIFCALRTKTVTAKRINPKILRLSSTFIYCIHPLVQFIFERLPGSFMKWLLAVPFVEWVLIYAVSFGIAYLIAKAELEKKITFIRVLH